MGNYCGCPQDPDYFKRKYAALDLKDVYVLLKSNRIGIFMLLLCQAVFLTLWICLNYVSGFSNYDGNPNVANVISHDGWWLTIELIVFAMGLLSISSELSMNERGLCFDADTASTYINFYICMLLLAIVANVVDAILSIVEVVTCTSTFCTASYGFLVVFIIMIFLLILIESFLLYRSFTYKLHLQNALMGKPDLFDLRVQENTTTPLMREIKRSQKRK